MQGDQPRKPSWKSEWERFKEPYDPPESSSYHTFHGSGENRWDTVSIIVCVIAVLAICALLG